MKKLGFAALALLPFVGGCVAYVPRPYGYHAYYRPSRVYVSPPPVVVAPPPPRVRVYW